MLQTCKKLQHTHLQISTTKLQKVLKRYNSMQLNHGDFFVLHPDDERVIPRMIQTHANKHKYIKEDKCSQFQHGVTMSIEKNKIARSGKGYKMGISVCFRESVVQRDYCKKFNIMLDSNMKWLDNDNASLAMMRRNENIDYKRKELNKSKNIRRMNELLNNITNMQS